MYINLSAIIPFTFIVLFTFCVVVEALALTSIPTLDSCSVGSTEEFATEIEQGQIDHKAQQ